MLGVIEHELKHHSNLCEAYIQIVDENHFYNQKVFNGSQSHGIKRSRNNKITWEKQFTYSATITVELFVKIDWFLDHIRMPAVILKSNVRK